MGRRKRKPAQPESQPKLDPEQRIAPQFDSVGVKEFLAPEPGEMGFRVLDNCAEDHEM